MNSDWRCRLRGDPANWLLDVEDNPSVYFWFQRDIVGRPEDAPAMIDARERILYSTPVQEIFAAQHENGYWNDPSSLDQPRYRATLWSLALLAELGVPRRSRRARAACEFVLQTHWKRDGVFNLGDASVAGLLVRALLYFHHPNDPRLARVIEPIAADAARGNIFALWALAELPRERRSCPVEDAMARGAQVVLDALARGDYLTFGAFPLFDDRDALLGLRVLALLGYADDSRASEVVEAIWRRQGEGARWSLEKSYNGSLTTRLDDAGVASKWATLNVLRVVTKRQGDLETRRKSHTACLSPSQI